MLRLEYHKQSMVSPLKIMNKNKYWLLTITERYLGKS